MLELPTSACLCLGDEATAVPSRPLGPHQRSWTAAQVDPASCIIELDTRARAELAAMSEAIRETPLPVTRRRAGQFDIPHLRQIMARTKHALDHETGIVVLDGLPLEDMDHDTALAVFWTLGGQIGRNVAQKWDGSMLYDVTDKGLAFGYGVRGSYTNVELLFHTDNAFGVAPPWYVGLLCLRPALAGGVSRFCSLVAVHDRMLESHPRLLARLYRPMLWDRQAEHASDAPPLASAPMFRWRDTRLTVRANPSLVRNAYALAARPMDDELDRALHLFRDLTEDPEFSFQLPIERGQMQFLNNLDIAHHRSAFRDAGDPALKRHLVRTWYRDAGQPSYDG